MKSNIYNIISQILFPIAFVAMFFIIGGTNHGATCWLGFGFILFSYLLIVLVPLLAPRTKSAHLFGVASSALNGIYFAINFIIGLLFIIKDFDEWKYPLLVEIIIFVLFFIYLLQVLRIDEITGAKEIKHKKEIYVLKELTSKAKIIMDNTNDMEMKKTVQLVYNELNTCQINSNENVKDLDDAISYNLGTLNTAVMSNNVQATQEIALSTIALIKKRKKKSKQ